MSKAMQIEQQRRAVRVVQRMGYVPYSMTLPGPRFGGVLFVDSKTSQSLAVFDKNGMNTV